MQAGASWKAVEAKRGNASQTLCWSEKGREGSRTSRVRWVPSALDIVMYKAQAWTKASIKEMSIENPVAPALEQVKSSQMVTAGPAAESIQSHSVSGQD